MAKTASGTMRELRREVAGSVTSLAQDIYQEIVRTTPKDKGTARASWTPPGKPTADNYNVVVTTNPLPYIEPLESGRSKQAPRGFIQPAIDKITRKANK